MPYFMSRYALKIRGINARICAYRGLSVFLGGFAALPQFSRKLLFARDRRRLERLAPTCLGNDAFVLNAAGESAQHRLEALAFSVSYLYQLKSFLLWLQPD